MVSIRSLRQCAINGPRKAFTESPNPIVGRRNPLHRSRQPIWPPKLQVRGRAPLSHQPPYPPLGTMPHYVGVLRQASRAERIGLSISDPDRPRDLAGRTFSLRTPEQRQTPGERDPGANGIRDEAIGFNVFHGFAGGLDISRSMELVLGVLRCATHAVARRCRGPVGDLRIAAMP